MDDQGVDLAAFQYPLGAGRGQEVHVQMEGDVDGVRAGGVAGNELPDFPLKGLGEGRDRHAPWSALWQIAVPGPPELVTMPSLRPLQGGLGGVDPPVGVKLFDRVQRMIPACLKMPS